MSLNKSSSMQVNNQEGLQPIIQQIKYLQPTANTTLESQKHSVAHRFLVFHF